MRVELAAVAFALTGLVCGDTSAAAQPDNVIKGFRLGESYSEALLPRLTQPVRIRRGGHGEFGSTVLEDAAGLDVHVCDGRVAAVIQTEPGDLHTFARLVVQETQSRGQGKGGASSVVDNAVPDKPSTSSINFVWPIPGGMFQVTYFAYGKVAPVVEKGIYLPRSCSN
jgi:hypothetical protein